MSESVACQDALDDVRMYVEQEIERTEDALIVLNDPSEIDWAEGYLVAMRKVLAWL